MPRIEFRATIERRTAVRNFYIYRGEERDGQRIGDLYIQRGELEDDPPQEIVIRIEWR